MFGETILLTRKNEQTPLVGSAFGVAATQSWTYQPGFHVALINSYEALLDGLRRAFYELARPFAATSLPVWGTQLHGDFLVSGGLRYPLVDVVDAGDYYVVRAEMPGLSKEQVSVFASRNTLQLRAERNQFAGEGVYLHREIAPTVFQRTITFPEEIVPSKIDAVMRDGILEIKILKSGAKLEEPMTKVVVR